MSNRQQADIAKLSATLAADNSRVRSYIDSLSGRIDEVVSAAANSDWNEVGRLCDFIARSSATYGYPLISYSAERVCRAATEGGDALELKRRLIKLIGTCGRVRRPGIEQEAAEPAEMS